MSLRKQLEGIKGAKEEEAKKQEEAQKQEEVQQAEQARLQAEEEFRDNFSKRNTLKQALEDFKGAKGDLTGAQTKRRGELKNIQGLIEEIKKENPEAEVPTAREAIVDPEADSDEERYVQAKEEVRAAAKHAKAQKEALATLGVESQGLNEEELEKAVTTAYKEADEYTRTFAREHPDSQLPEVKEIQNEIIQAGADRIEEKIHGEHFPQALSRALENYVKDRERASGTKPYVIEVNPHLVPEHGKSRLQNEITNSILKEAVQSKDFEKLVTVLESEMPGDALLAQSVTEALKRLLFNYKYDKEGKAGVRNYNIRARYEKDALDTMGEVYEALKESKIPEEFNTEDGRGFRDTARPLLASALNESLQRASEKIIELAKLRREKEGLPAAQKDLEQKSYDLENKRNRLESLSRSISHSRQNLLSAQETLRKDQERMARLRVVAANPHEALSKGIAVRPSYDDLNIELDFFEKKIQAQKKILNERHKVFEDAVTQAQTAYDKAKRAERGLFNKKKLQKEEDDAKSVLNQAKLALENIARDNDYSTAESETRRLRSEYKDVCQEIEKAVGKISLSREGIRGYDFGEFLQSFETSLQRSERHVADITSDIATTEAERDQLESEIETLREELVKETGYRSPDQRTVGEAIRTKSQRLQERISSLMRELQGTY